MYYLVFLELFKKRSEKLVKKNPELGGQIKKALNLLRHDPFYPSLRSHKVDTLLHGEANASWVNGDLRIIWEYDENEVRILNILNIGGHSGKGKVYK